MDKKISPRKNQKIKIKNRFRFLLNSCTRWNNKKSIIVHLLNFAHLKIIKIFKNGYMINEISTSIKYFCEKTAHWGKKTTSYLIFFIQKLKKNISKCLFFNFNRTGFTKASRVINK